MAKTVPDLSNGELLEGLAGAKKELFNLRFQNATGQLKSSARIKQVKKESARILTEIRTREIAAAEAVAESGE